MSHRPQILLITDPAEAEILGPLLEKLPVRYTLCRNSEELSAQLSEQYPDLVLARISGETLGLNVLAQLLPDNLPLLLLCDNYKQISDFPVFFSRTALDYCCQTGEIADRLHFLLARSEQQSEDTIGDLRKELTLKEGEIMLYEELLQKAGESFTDCGIQARLLERQISENIDYATVAKAVAMPDNAHLTAGLREFMLLYLPMERVSGDFYWFSAFGGKKVLALGDCTGHGVPGALLSILAIIMLERLVNVEEIMESEHILSKMDVYLEKVLNTPDRRHDDTIDLAICIVDKVIRKFEFAGAKNSLLMIDEQGEQKIFNGSRRGLGGGKHSPTVFKKEVIPYRGEETFFVFSDGFRDQVGHSRQRFGRQRFCALLAESLGRPLEERPEFLKSAFYDWKSDMPQLDDILVIGFKP